MTLLAWYKKWTLAVVELVNAPRAGNYAQYHNRYVLTPARREELFSAARLAFERGVAHATTGQISMRLSDTQFALSAARVDLARLSEADVVTGALAFDAPLHAAAQHGDWHRTIYQRTPAGGILVCQPPHALALARAGQLPDAEQSDVYAAIGGVRLVEHGSPMLPALHEHAPDHHALLLPGVGAIVWSAGPRDAVYRAEALEYAARMTVIFNSLRR